MIWQLITAAGAIAGFVIVALGMGALGQMIIRWLGGLGRD